MQNIDFCIVFIFIMGLIFSANVPKPIDEQARFLVVELLENLDNDVLLELSQGNEKDLEKVAHDLYDSCVDFLTGKMPKQVGVDSIMYLDRLGKAVDDEYKKRDINYFAMSVFPNFDSDWHTIEWGHWVMQYPNILIKSRRGGGKSEFFSCIYSIWKACSYTPRTSQNVPLVRVKSKDGLIVSASQDLVVDELIPKIIGHVEDNPYLFEMLCPKDKKDLSKTKLKFKNGAVIKAKSYGSQIRGRHPDWIVFDDILTENQLYSKDARDKAIQWFKGTASDLVLQGQGQNIVVGTPFHENDLYANLAKNPQWKAFEYPAIYPDGRILASRRFSYSNIKASREKNGALAFSREMLCKPVSGDSTIFPYDLMAKCLSDKHVYIKNMLGESRKFVRTVIGVDLAISAKVGADYFVCTTVGVTQNGERHILNIWRGHGIEYQTQKAKVKSLCKEFKPDVVYIESNQYQVVFPQELDKEGLPVFAYTTTEAKNLKTGLPSLVLLFEKEKYVIPYGNEESIDISDTLLGELSSIAYTDRGLKATGSHDDMAMSLYIAEEAIRKTDFDFLYI